MQTVGHLDKHHANVFAHSQQQLAEILGLCRGLVAEDAARNLGQALDYACYFVPEVLANILDGEVSILDYIVQQGRAYRRRAEAYFLTRNLGHRYRMHDIRLAAAPRTPAWALRANR